jgi:hypothetical protein
MTDRSDKDVSVTTPAREAPIVLYDDEPKHTKADTPEEDLAAVIARIKGGDFRGGIGYTDKGLTLDPETPGSPQPAQPPPARKPVVEYHEGEECKNPKIMNLEEIF